MGYCPGKDLNTMAEERIQKLNLPPVYQLGYVVNDVEATCKYYQTTFGIGPFDIIDEVDMDGAILRGKSVNTRMKVALGKADKVKIEFIQ